MSGLCLGIDLGSTSVKVSLVDILTKAQVFCTSETTGADVPYPDEPARSEQDVGKILSTLCDCLMRITDRNRANVRCICVSGQMHGVLLWDSDLQKPLEDEKLESVTSHLITWQDKRASSEFIMALPKPDSHQCLAAGFGCVTLFWMKQFEPSSLLLYNTVGGVMDYLVMLLCGLDKPVMSSQIATSWGYFCSETRTWNSKILQEANFPVYLLPVVVRSGSKAGSLCRDWFGIAKGTPVLAGLGDLQCSFVSGSKQPMDAVMNISTSSQVCYPVLTSGFIPSRSDVPTPIAYFPYFDQSYLAVAASLNGGNTLSAFVRMLEKWFATFDFRIERDEIWKKLTDLAASGDYTCGANGLLIHPLLYGERHDPQLTASMSGANEQNTSLEFLFRALCEGLVNNLHHMMPLSKLIESGVQRLVLTGSVVDRQPYVKEYVKRMYSPLTVIECPGTDAAFGAALVACKYLETAASPDKDATFQYA